MATCSVIIVSYYTGASLFAVVKCALKQENLAELIIVNNENTPDILARLRQMALGEPRLKIVTGQGNVGFAKASNLGAKKATGDFILLLNPHCLLPPAALADGMAAFNDVPGTMLAGCFVQKSDGSEREGGRQPLLTPGRVIYESLGLKRLLPLQRFNPQKAPMPSETHEVPAISSDFMLIKTSDYNRFYGMDEGYFHHVEDADFCMRIRNTGGKIVCIPRVKVTYMTQPEGKRTTRAIEWNRVKGCLRYFNTHFQGKTVPGLVLLADLALLLHFVVQSIWLFISKPQEVPKLQSLASRRLIALAAGAAELSDSNELAGNTVLLTGATSHIGISVMRRLLAAGANVIGMSRNEPLPYRHERLRWVKGNLIEKPWNLHGQNVTVAIHCAPLWHLPPAMDKIAEAGVKRVIAFSTTDVFAKVTNRYEKLRVEKLVQAEKDITEHAQAQKLNCTILRPTLVYGGGLADHINRLASIIRRFGIFPVYPPALGKRQPVHADDLAFAAMQIINNAATFGKSYNISGAEALSYRDMIARIFMAYGKKPRFFPTTLLPFALDVIGKVARKPDINSEMAYAMDDDQAFFHDEAKKDFNFMPRKFLIGGIRDIEGF